ncbi:hypothetical protein L7F22_016903 [Adiantum nelumboides]|nr:hypothetical protein [Adiantum nelumboides]
MADNNEEGRNNVDSFEFANEGASEETPMLVNYLITRLQQAMANLALQGEVQQQLQAYGFLPPHQEERVPEKSLGETSKRGISKTSFGIYIKATVYKKIYFEEQKQQFCAGLPEDLNEYVNSQRLKTILVVIHHTMVAARINFQQGAKRNLKPMETKEKHEHKGKNQFQNSSKGNFSNNKAKEKGVYKGKNRLTPEELECYCKDNRCFKCGEQGHSYQTCPQRNARNEQPRASIIEASKENVHCKGSPLSYAWGKVREHDAFILFDPGSTHNFISHELAAKLGIQEFEMGDAMKADAAFIGQDASVTPLIGKLRLHIQGYVDKEDFFISPLKHEDVILGASWFDRLAASIKFPERRISFKFREKNMMPRQKTARQWDKAPYEVDDLSTNEKSHILDEVLIQIPAHIFIARFRDEEGDSIKTTIMPREIWTLHRRPKISSAIRAVHLENFFRLPPWGTDYMRAHELMSSIQYDGKAMPTDNDGAKVEVLITKDIINEALHFIPGAYDLIPKTKAIDNEKAFLKKPPRYTEPFLHMALVMALCVAEKRQVRCDFAKYTLESLVEANLKNSTKNKLYMNDGPMLTRIAYQALGMIEDLLAASSQASLIQQVKYVPKAVRTTSSATSSKASKTTRSKKSSSEEERTETDQEQDSQESAQEEVPKEVETTVPSEYESDEEDTSVPLERKSQRPRSTEQILLDEAMARVEARRKELVDARAAKAAGKTGPVTMEEARRIRLEKDKAIQKERRRIEAEQKTREEAEAAKAAQTQETEVVDLSGTLEYLKKLKREKHTAEQRAAQLVREKIKEALSRKAEEPVLEPTQSSPKRPRQEEEEEIEDIQADPIPPSPINIPPAPPSSPITPFPPASTPQTPPSPLPLETPLSPPTPISPQQQHLFAETSETPAPLTEETHQPMETQTSPEKETAQHMDKVDEEEQTEKQQHQPTKVDVPILMVQDEEPTNQEAILEVRSFDYTKLIQTLSRQFQCQQVVAKETEIQKTRANQAQEEIANLRTALELVTKERDSSARENKNLIRDLMDLQSQLTRKEAQNHELIKNEKKMKEQIKQEDAKFQKLNASYNTVKNTLTALLQNQEPAAAAPSTSDSATLNTLAALQAELQTEKLQRQLLVSGFMSQTAQHEAKVKQLEEELAKAKADLQAVGSLASTSHIQQAETHVPIQPPQLPEMPEFQGTEEEEQQRPAPGALDIREEIEQEIEDLPKGPAKEYLLYEKKVMQSAALAFLQPEE